MAISPPISVLLVNGVRRGRGAWRARRIASTATPTPAGARAPPALALWLRDGEDADGYAAATVGALQGTYRPHAIYGRVRDTAGDAAQRRGARPGGGGCPTQDGLDAAIIMAEGVEFGRTLANRAANDLYPERMAEVARELEADGCTVEVLDVRPWRSSAWARCWASARARPTSRG